MGTILILESDPAIMNLFRLLLPTADCTLLEATTADEAYQLVDEADWGVNLIIADVKLGASPASEWQGNGLRPFLRQP